MNLDTKVLSAQCPVIVAAPFALFRLEFFGQNRISRSKRAATRCQDVLLKGRVADEETVVAVHGPDRDVDVLNEGRQVGLPLTQGLLQLVARFAHSPLPWHVRNEAASSWLFCWRGTANYWYGEYYSESEHYCQSISRQRA